LGHHSESLPIIFLEQGTVLFTDHQMNSSARKAGLYFNRIIAPCQSVVNQVAHDLETFLLAFEVEQSWLRAMPDDLDNFGSPA